MRRNVTNIRINLMIFLTSLTFIVWFGYELYKYYTEDIVPPDIKKLIKPLSSDLQITVLDQLEDKNDIPAFSQTNLNSDPLILPSQNIDVESKLEALEDGTSLEIPTTDDNLLPQTLGVQDHQNVGKYNSNQIYFYPQVEK